VKEARIALSYKRSSFKDPHATITKEGSQFRPSYREEGVPYESILVELKELLVEKLSLEDFDCMRLHVENELSITVTITRADKSLESFNIVQPSHVVV
jgi:hypothetical protein